MSFGNSPIEDEASRRKYERFKPEADAARAARLAGHKSLLRRLLERLSLKGTGDATDASKNPR